MYNQAMKEHGGPADQGDGLRTRLTCTECDTNFPDDSGLREGSICPVCRPAFEKEPAPFNEERFMARVSIEYER